MLPTKIYLKSRDSERLKKKDRQNYVKAGVAILFPDKVEIRSKYSRSDK